MNSLPARLWKQTEGQGIAEYAVLMAVVLIMVVGAVHVIGFQASGVFSRVAEAIAEAYGD